MSFKKVGIIGAGTMGSGIATGLGLQGVEAHLVDTAQDSVDRGIGAAKKFYDRAAEKGKISDADAAKALSLISGSTDLESLIDCDLIIEAIFEEFGVKQELFTKLNAIISDDVVVATNTSCLQVSDLAETINNPSRFLGLHYFNPAAINPIVEVVRGAKTAPDIFEKCMEFCKMTGKKPLACKDSFGFAVNRFFVPYANEAIRLLDEGVGTTAQIDRVAQECLGLAAGPFVVMNLVKPRIMYHAQTNLASHGAFYTLAKSLAAKGDTDYTFDVGDDASGTAESDAIIADRLRAGALFPVLQELDEDVASAHDIDMGAGLALRFGKTPCKLIDDLGRAEVMRIVSLVTEKYGHSMPKSVDRAGTICQ